MAIVNLGQGENFGKVVKHATSKGFIKELILKEMKRLNRQLNQMEILSLLNNRCVCPSCERFILRSEGWTPEIPVGTCDHCGFSGITKSVRDYIMDEDWKS